VTVTLALVHQRLTELSQQRSFDVVLELFASLGYQYAEQGNTEPPIYLAQHHDFHVIYTHLSTDDLLRTVERPIVEHTLRKLHPFALFVFANRDVTRWDFVNVKYVAEDITLSQVEGSGTEGRRRTIRRIHVGANERLHTAAERIAMLEVPDPETSALELQSLHDKAFDVEEVTKQFYRDYVQVFSNLCDDIDKRNSRRRVYRRRGSDPQTDAQELLNRLMFLYFIQKKGWLDDRRDYLHKHFEAHYEDDPEGASFYTDFLFPLFVTLSNEDAEIRSQGDIPFLNGGLFEESVDAPLTGQLIVGNDVFRSIFDDLLERYNFTVREDTPLDVEVAIDPEMLGQVFENLVLGIEKGVDRRKATGSYYTPRVIVHFMCRQALKEYLAGESGLEPASIEALMDVGPAEQLTPEEVAGLGEMITEPQARLLRGLVKDARVLDPAVGSGAFLVGMLYQMVALTKLLDVRLHGLERVQRRNYDYDLKRGLIERNLYGVDIQPEAVRICELRLWLSLMVEYQRADTEPVPPLPNLSYRVRVGDSLIERLFGEPVQLDELAGDTMARQLVDRIQTEKQAYFKEPDLDEKRRRELRILAHMCELTATLVGAKRGAVLTKMSAEVPGLFGSLGEELLTRKQRKAKEEAEAELARYDRLMTQVKEVYDKVKAMQGGELPAEARDVDALRTQLGLSFIWRLDFAEVFAEKGGFDVVIANPPYVRMEEIKELKTDLKRNYPAVYRGRADLYVYFYHVGLDMLHKNGVLTFISSNKFMRARYGDGLRRLLTQDGTLRTVIDFGDLPIFEATTYPCVLVARNGRPSAGEVSVQALNVRSMATLERLADAARSEGWLQPQRTLSSEGWALERPEVLSLMEKLRQAGIPLGEYVGGQIYYGVKTGLNKAFVIDQATRDRLVAEDPRSTEIIKPWLRGRDIKRWKVEWQNLYVLFTHRGVTIKRYPAIEAYLKPFKKRLLKRATSANHEWYELQQPQMGVHLELDKPKVIYPHFNTQSNFAYDEAGAFSNDKTYVIPNVSLFLLGILNSNAAGFLLRHLCPSVQQGYMEFRVTYVQRIPVPSADPLQRVAIEALVRKLLDAKGQGPQVADWERELNALVYELYGLTEEEIAIIEGR